LKRIILLLFLINYLYLSADFHTSRDEPGTLNWSYETNSSIFQSSPMIDSNGNIYFGNLSDSLHCLSPDGNLNWTFPTGSIITASPAFLPDGRICFGSRDENFYVLNDDGSLSWSFDAGSDILFSSAVRYDGKIYFSTDSDILYALDFDGNVIWSTGIQEEIRTAPVIGPDGTIYLITSTRLYALNENGYTKWFIEADSYSPPVVDAENIFFYNGRYLKAVDFDGNYIFAINTENNNNKYSTPAIGKNGNIYLGTTTGQIRAYNRNGLFLWQSANSSGSQVKTGPLIDAEGNIYYGCLNDCFYSIASDGAQNWEFQTGGSITSSPSITPDGNLVFGDADGTLYCLYGYESELSQFGSPMYGINCSRTFSYYSNIRSSQNRVYFSNTVVNSTEEDTLIVYNNTDETVQIYTECSSNRFQISCSSNQIAPNDSLEILISFQPIVEELIESQLIISTNDPAAPELNIYLLGNGIELDPGDIIWDLPVSSDGISSPAMDSNGVIYFTCDSFLYAVTENRQILWTYYYPSANVAVDIPIITLEDKILLISRPYNQLLCIDNDGSLIWSYDSVADLSYSPAVDLEGNIFLTNTDYLISLSSEGIERWTYEFDFEHIYVISSPVISADGTIYLSKNESQLEAITKNGLHKFTFEGEEGFNQPVIDDDGTIYITSFGMNINKFYVIHPDGSLIHTRNLYGWAKSPVIIGDDLVYYALQVSGGSRVYALDKDDFSLEWTSQLISGYCADSPTLAADGSIYLAGTAGSGTYSSFLSSIDSLGQIKWEFNPYEFEFSCRAENTPLIHPNGTIIMTARNSSSSDNSYLFTIHENAFPSDGPWSTLGQDATHSNMANNSIIPGPNIMINRDYLDFGLVEPGSSENINVTVYNDGDSLLTYFYELTGDGYSSSSPVNSTLAQEDSVLIEIVFAPQANNDPIHHGSLIMNSNDYDQPQILITLFGRSNLEGTLKWKTFLRSELHCTPAIDDMGNIYVFDSYLYCVDSNGEIKWVRTDFNDNLYNCDNVTISDDNEIIYVPSMRAVDSTGVLLFVTPVMNGNFTTSISLDLNEQLYVGNYKSDGSGLFVYDCDGMLLWSDTNTDRIYQAPVIDPEGNIYFIGTSMTSYGDIYSFDSTGNMNWSVNGEFYRYNLALGFNSSLYSLDYVCVGMGDIRAVLKCFDREGNFHWEYTVPIPGYGYPSTSPVVDAQGNIYFANLNGELFSIDQDGNLNWYYESFSNISSTPAIAANGLIYVGFGNDLCAINQDGTLRWSYETEGFINDNIAITDDETIYFTNETGYLYAIHGLNGGLADSPWPMIHQNTKHNCRLDEEFITEVENETVLPKVSFSNYPNPFNPSTTIEFSIQNNTNVNLSIFNIKGQRVATLLNELMLKGKHSIIWSGFDEYNNPVSSGIYFYKLSVNGKTEAARKCLLLK
jgi:outer membrane protein assembly factor BamB